MKAIETFYAGCRFRSRLEARWAVVFDRLEWTWQYEPEGFEGHGWGGKTIRYLPDFYLPDFGTWVEVKGSQSQLDADWERMEQFLDWGSPMPGIDYSFMSESQGLLVLGDIPRPTYRQPLFPLIQHRKGLFEARAALTEAGPVNIYTESEPPILERMQPPVLAPYYLRGDVISEATAVAVSTPPKVEYALIAGRSHRPEETSTSVRDYLPRIR